MKRQSVTGFTPGCGRIPAAFVQNMQFVRVMEILPRLSIYKPKIKPTLRCFKPVKPFTGEVI